MSMTARERGTLIVALLYLRQHTSEEERITLANTAGTYEHMSDTEIDLWIERLYSED
jgi:hypothetical protein